MRKDILTLVVSVVFFSLFSTTDASFKLWDAPSVSTTYLSSPEVPISFNDDISVLGLVVNFFADIELDYTESENLHSVAVELSVGLKDDHEVGEHVDIIHSSYEQEEPEEVDFVEQPVIKEAVVAEPVIKEAVFAEPVIEEAVVTELVIEEAVFAEPVIDEVVVAEPVIEEAAVTELVTEEAVVAEPVIEEAVVEDPVVFETVITPTVNEVQEDKLPNDKEIIRQHPNIKENAKKLILEALDEGDITIDDVFNLLNKYAGKDLNKKKVKQFIKNNRK